MGEVTRVRGKNLQGEDISLEKSQPLQMSLFQTFLPREEKYSNTIELYDVIPKSYASRQLNKMRENGKYLPILKREFQHKNPVTGETVVYQVSIKPARLEDKEGNVREYYPTEREELVEEALRKIACDNLSGVYLDDSAGVQFTLYQLKRELAARNHSIHLSSLIDALNICNETIIEVKTKDGTELLKSSIFPVLLISNRKQWLENPKDAYCYVQFNPLVTHSINRLTYRQFDYVTFMEYKSQLARWLHKRLFHNFVQASIRNTYHIMASTIIRDSGLLNARRFRDNLKAIDKAFCELEGKHVAMNIEKSPTYDRNNKKITDVKYTLRPSMEFVREITAANRRKQIISEQAAKGSYLMGKPK
jgi:hypothetical protein